MIKYIAIIGIALTTAACELSEADRLALNNLGQQLTCQGQNGDFNNGSCDYSRRNAEIKRVNDHNAEIRKRNNCENNWKAAGYSYQYARAQCS